MRMETAFEQLETYSDETQLNYMWELAEIPDSKTIERTTQIKTNYSTLEQQFIQDIGEILEESRNIETLKENTNRKIAEYQETDINCAEAFQKFVDKNYFEAYNELEIPVYERALASMSDVNDPELFFNYMGERLDKAKENISDTDDERIKGLIETGLYSTKQPEEFADYLKEIKQSLGMVEDDLETRMNNLIEELYLKPSPVDY